jgi:thiosulfate/3-mercaptopyruvate sulfurtransferase
MSRPAAFLAAVLIIGTAASPARAQDDPGVLVTPSWLQQHLKDPGLVILQVGTRATFDKEHIAGSQFIQVSDVASTEPPGNEMLPEDSLRHQLEKFGISDDSRLVVVMADDYVPQAGRMLFTLSYTGLGDRAVFLDGGLSEWKRTGLPVTSVVQPAKPGTLTRRFNPQLIVDHVYMQSHSATEHVRLVDARTANYYAGEDFTDQRGLHQVGHIAGARNIPFTSVLDDSSRVLPRAKLLELFKAAGITAGDTVVAYCHSGQQATVLLLAARRAGFATRLYDGSMNDWQARRLPLVKGP